MMRLLLKLFACWVLEILVQNPLHAVRLAFYHTTLWMLVAESWLIVRTNRWIAEDASMKNDSRVQESVMRLAAIEKRLKDKSK